MPNCNRLYLLILLFFVLVVNACSNAVPLHPEEKPTAPLETPTPKPTPEQTPPPEEEWRCKMSNGEGRVFSMTANTRFKADAKVKLECMRVSRHCIPLGCKSY